MKFGKFFTFFCLSLLLPVAAFAQEAGKIQKEEQQIDQERQLREKIEKEKPSAPVEEEKAPPAQPPVSGEQKAFIKTIVVIDNTLLPQSEIDGIVAPYQNKELSLSGMQEVVDRLTDAYRKRGYVTSRAYLAPQKIMDQTLKIRAVEGTTGDIEVKGNKYFSSVKIRSAIHLEKGKPFNYNDLKKSLVRLNEHPDRKVKAVLVPGKTAGSTDIMLEVTDRMPVHLALDYDNYASRFVGKDRYTGTVSDNNLFGFDDILSLRYQISDNSDYQLISTRYLLPVGPRVKLMLSAADSTVKLGKEFEGLDARGKSRNYTAYATYDLVSADDLQVVLNAGFEYIDSFNFQFGSEQSRDRLRPVRLGFDLDYSDQWGGRTIFSPQSSLGIPDIMAGLEDKDNRASRVNAGGKYVKHTFSLLRLQSMPFSSTLLWKNQAQVSPYVLTASEQFQVGGISNVRGYPSGELVGDQGYTTTLEWAAPVYGFPKDIRVPFSSASVYDALRLAVFYDLGYVSLHEPQPGEAKDKTLRGIGCGVRFNLPEDFSLRLDFAWPLGGRTPSDGRHFHPWVFVSKQF